MHEEVAVVVRRCLLAGRAGQAVAFRKSGASQPLRRQYGRRFFLLKRVVHQRQIRKND